MQTDHHMARMSQPPPLPYIVLDLTPHEVMRALEALRHGGWYVALQVADKLAAAAPAHMAIIAEVET